MQLRERDLEAYVRLAEPGIPGERLDREVARIGDAFGKGERHLADTRVAEDPSGGIRAALRLSLAGTGTVVLSGPFLADAGADVHGASLVPEAMQRARDLEARTIRCRPDKGKLLPLCRAALLGHGFRELGERIEFRAAVADLPADDGTPLSWRDFSYMGLVPGLRGRGLGTWVHRRGFRILKEQGGKLYRGGTAAANSRMLRLFLKHGCEEVKRMVEFEWRAPPSRA